MLFFSTEGGVIWAEPEMINGLRWYRILFMIGASFMGILGVVITFIYFVIKLCSLNSFGMPYLVPFSQLNLQSKEALRPFHINLLFSLPDSHVFLSI